MVLLINQGQRLGMRLSFEGGEGFEGPEGFEDLECFGR